MFVYILYVKSLCSRWPVLEKFCHDFTSLYNFSVTQQAYKCISKMMKTIHFRVLASQKLFPFYLTWIKKGCFVSLCDQWLCDQSCFDLVPLCCTLLGAIPPCDIQFQVFVLEFKDFCMPQRSALIFSSIQPNRTNWTSLNLLYFYNYPYANAFPSLPFEDLTSTL